MVKRTCAGDGMGQIKMFTSSLQPFVPSESNYYILQVTAKSSRAWDLKVFADLMNFDN